MSRLPQSHEMMKNRALRFVGGLGGVKGSKGGNYVRPGRYIMQLKALKTVVSASKGEDLLIWEMVCIHVFPETAAYPPALRNRDQPQAGTAPAHIVGEEVGWSLKATELSTRPNLKAALANILYEGDEAKMDAESNDDDLMSLFADPCPLANMAIEMDANTIVTRAGKPFTKVQMKREVPPAEVIATVPDAVRAKYFPPGYLEKLAEAASA